MKPSNEEVYNALITLQNLCSEISEVKSCLDCPLWNYNAGKCGLKNEMPEHWTINGVSEWKAF